MPAFYSVIQYVPDTVINERINIGVVAFGGGVTKTHFLHSWQRVRCMGLDDISVLREFTRRAELLDEASIRKSAEKWSRSIQFTKPAGSLLTVDELLLDAAARFLVDPPPQERSYRVKDDIRKLALRNLKSSLTRRMGGIGSLLVKENFKLPSAHGSYEFDLAVSNGQPYAVVQAISFEIPPTKKLDKEVNATAFAMDEVLDIKPDTPFAVVAAPPISNQTDSYLRASEIFRARNISFITDTAFPGWSEELSKKIPSPRQQ